MLDAGRNLFGLIRFGCGIFKNESVRFGSEIMFPRFDAVRPAFLRTRRGSVRFGSVRFCSASGSGRFQSYTLRFGSVGPVRFGFLFLLVDAAARHSLEVSVVSGPVRHCLASLKHFLWATHGARQVFEQHFWTLELACARMKAFLLDLRA